MPRRSSGAGHVSARVPARLWGAASAGGAEWLGAGWQVMETRGCGVALFGRSARVPDVLYSFCYAAGCDMCMQRRERVARSLLDLHRYY